MSSNQTLDAAAAQPAQFRPRRLAHANLYVGDLEPCTEFYNKVCGFELVRREPAVWATFLSGGTTHHDVGLMRATPQTRVGRGGYVQAQGRGQVPGLNHYGWEMENEALLVDAYKRAKGNVKLHATMDHLISHSVYVADPEGNVHEFYADALKDWRTIFHLGDETLVSAHWDPLDGPPSKEQMYTENAPNPKVEGAIFNPVCMTHSILAATDLEKMRRFFVDVAGLEPVEEEADRYVLLRATAQPFDIALIQANGSVKQGAHAFAFRLQDGLDLVRCHDRLKKDGVDVRRVIDEPAKEGFVVADPDGRLVELYRRSGPPASFFEADVRPYLA